MREEEKKIYELIVKRFLALFCEDAVLENKTITAKVNDMIFIKKGSSIKRAGWLEIYPIRLSEIDLPDVNGKIMVSNSNIIEKETQPPKRFSHISCF